MFEVKEVKGSGDPTKGKAKENPGDLDLSFFDTIK
jgi:uncharacterized protein YjbJ (UPF0337 family)